ncbi:MAG: hypothetical protein LBE22_10500 [Azoarcus sp.]|jgi:hypothetical protein|nr:hypothetical protein [Azoarcus sp.]
MSSSAAFRVTYCGSALDAHTMDVRELAPALLAVGDMMAAASNALNGNKVRARTEVKASFKTGSFGIDLILSQDFVNQVSDLLTGKGAQATINATALIAIIFGAGRGLVGVLKKLKNRKIKSISENENGVIIYLEDDEFIETERHVYTLLTDRSVRENLAAVISPINRDGIDRVAFGDDLSFSEQVESCDAVFFETPPVGEDLIIDESRRMSFSIISLAFKEDNKWRLYDGNATIQARIIDTEFLSRVDQNMEAFSKGDVLVCQVRMQQWQTREGVRTEYTVEQVIDHKQAMRQIRLPFVGG